MLHDPLNDVMVSIKKAEQGGRSEVELRPASKLIGRVLQIMQEYGYITEFEYLADAKGGKFRVRLGGNINDCGVIKPRFSVKKTEFERLEGRYLPAQDFGVLILTTTQGVMSHSKAKEKGVGGKLLAYVY